MICLEKFEKDIITVENIIIDFKKQIKESSIAPSIISPILFLLSVWLISCLITTDKLENKIIIWLVLPASLLILRIFTGVLIDNFKGFLTISRGRFIIKTDKLVHKLDEVVSPPGQVRSVNSRPCTLEFSKFGKFCIYDGTNYHSSKQFKMWYDELFRSSKIGDEFYLVIDDKKKILIVYNTKFFELKE